jgi:hypothetical protein
MQLVLQIEIAYFSLPPQVVRRLVAEAEVYPCLVERSKTRIFPSQYLMTGLTAPLSRGQRH